MLKISLDGSWKFKLAKSPDAANIPSQILKQIKKWNSASIPGTVHTDLLYNKLIGDPFFSDNELKLNWISESDWLYEKKFNLPENYKTSTPVNLVFEGIDTIASISLNGVKIACTDNMSRRYLFNVTDLLKPTNNVLSLLLYSPLKVARELENKYGKLPVALNSERVYIRKAQYSFGWDWGPSLPTSGIWKNVYLEQINPVELNQITFNIIDADERKAEIEIGILLKGSIKDVSKIKIILKQDDIKCAEKILKPEKHEVCTKIVLDYPKLWYPNGEGEQTLYDLRAEIISDEGKILTSGKRRVGIRKVELKLDDDGKSIFRFIVNGKPLFVKGVNWIPADSFLPRVTKEKYFALLKLAQEANVNMVRVWGGGIYESDYFYELCDEMGLMVWQDFLFACGSYPEHIQFIENIKAEVEEIVMRLRHHPSIAIWCGNNENEWLWYQDQKSSLEKMPGYKIYHELLPSLLKTFDPHRAYWPSSPFGNGDDPNYQGNGNNHQWDIWSRWIDYDTVVNDHSLFVTEFGFQGPANTSTMNNAIPTKNRKTYDRIFEHHNKQTEGTERIFRFMASHLPVRNSWEDFIYLGQLNQALSLKTCIEHWRSNYPQTNGTIIWQINDCWPVVSWSLIDSSLAPKIAYYAVKSSFSQRMAVLVKKENYVEVIFLNQKSESFNGRLKVLQFDLRTGKEVLKKIFKLNSAANSSESLCQISLADRNTIFVSYLYNKEKKIIHKNIFYPYRWKHAPLQKVNVRKKIIMRENNYYLEISTGKPALFVDLYNPKLVFSERGFSVMPEEKILVRMNGKLAGKIKAKEIRVFTLNNYLNDRTDGKK